MLTVFVLLSFAVDVPAGIERSVAALALGLRALGHRAAIITRTLSKPLPAVDIIQLRTLRLEGPLTEEALLDAVESGVVVVEALPAGPRQVSASAGTGVTRVHARTDELT